jgi:hypothetical protein
MIRKTAQAFQVNQPRPKSLPAYFTDQAWAFLEKLSPDLCGTLMVEREGDDDPGHAAAPVIKVYAVCTHAGRPVTNDAIVFVEGSEDSGALTNYCAIVAANFTGLLPKAATTVVEMSPPVVTHQEPPAVKVVPTPRKKRGEA